jgi:hypothetical protein
MAPRRRRAALATAALIAAALLLGPAHGELDGFSPTRAQKTDFAACRPKNK